MNAYLQTLAQNNKFMGAVAIDSSGREVYNQAFGVIAEGDNPSPANNQTEYRIGSITKTFTAVMIMQLIEEDALSLSTPLANFYPDLPQAEKITIEHLLRHQSGLFNFTNDPDYQEWMTEPRSKEQMLNLFRSQKPEFKPGEKTSYSNTNYVVLGYIIEKITHEPYAAQLKKRIADPLNFQHTYYGDAIEASKNEAASFRFEQDKWTLMPETDMSLPGGAGAIVSTADELTDFIQALFNGDLVSKTSLEKMLPTENSFGLGLMKIPFYDTFAYSHNGGIDGFQSNLSYFPQEDVAFAFTGNALNYPMNSILIGTLSIYFDRDFEIPAFSDTSLELSRDEMNRYTGTYQSPKLPFKIKVFIEKGVLKAQATGQSKITLTASSQTTMRYDQADLVMEFHSLSDGRYQQFLLKQGGGQFTFTRQE